MSFPISAFADKALPVRTTANREIESGIGRLDVKCFDCLHTFTPEIRMFDETPVSTVGGSPALMLNRL